MRVKAALSMKMLAANLLLCVLFLPGVLADCATDLFITTPVKMKALSGSCLQIPCNFRSRQEHEFDRGENFGVWIKNYPYFDTRPENVVFNSSGTVRIYPMNITGDLSQNQCTTLFSRMTSTYTDSYYFRVHSSSLRAIAVCDPLQITVIDSPPGPSMEIPDNLREKATVNVSCSAFNPCPQFPPNLTLSHLQDSYNTGEKMEKNADGTLTAKIWKSVTLTDKHDGHSITCSAAYPVNEGKDVKRAEETRTLSVSYSPKNTTASMSPSGLVPAGTMVNLTCFSRAKPPVRNFTWFKIINSSPMNVYEGEFYSFNATDGGTFYCVATNDLGNETSSEIHLNIEGLAGGSMVDGALLGGIIAIVLLVCLVVSIIIAVKMWRKLKSAESSQQSLYRTGDEMAAAEPKRQTDDEEDGIHYGEIDFSKQRPNPSSNQGQDSGQQQETLYAQVKGSGSGQANDSPDDLYAQVKRD